MKRILVSILFLCGISAAVSGNDYVRVSQKDPRYFETTDSKTWVPVVMNYLVPDRAGALCCLN